MTIKQRTAKLLEALNKDVFEKQEVIALALLSAISGESIFLLGPPGVAKSLIARRLKFAFKGGQSFEYLMNRFSTPDEIFGPVAISKLKNDEYERVTEGYLPDASIVFLDEIWKASPSIQNSLLTILNEKKYRNGKKELDVNIRGLISASNELPEKGQGLEALWDRFIIRLEVSGVSDKNNFNKMISKNLTSYEDNIAEELKLNDEDYKSWSSKINNIKVPEEVFNVIHVIRASIQNRNNRLEEQENQIYISDRRWRKIIRLLRTSAFLNERESVDLMDCFLIAYCIWSDANEFQIVQDIVAESIKEYGYSMNLNTESIKQEIQEFDEEVCVEIEKEKKRYEEEFKVFNGEYYEIVGLKRNIKFKYIKTTDYLATNNTQKKVPLYNSNNQIHYVTIINDDEGKIRVHDYNWHNCTILTHKVTYVDTITNKPNKRLIKVWNKVVENLVKQIQSEINSVEAYREKNHAGLKTNLFVNNILSDLVEHNLHATTQELQELQLEVEKIKDYYDTIE